MLTLDELKNNTKTVSLYNLISRLIVLKKHMLSNKNDKHSLLQLIKLKNLTIRLYKYLNKNKIVCNEVKKYI